MKPDKRISIKDYRWWKTPKIQIVQTLFSSIRQYYVRMNLTDILAIKSGYFVGTCRAISRQMAAFRCGDPSKCQV
jgi:hypothetical protein